MRQRNLIRLTSVAIAAVALPLLAQNPASPEPSRTYHFTNPPASAEAYQELATVIRTVTDARNVSIPDARRDATSAQIEFSGRGESPDAAEWVLKQLDKPLGPPASGIASAEFHGFGRGYDNFRVITLAHTTSRQGMQEILTVLRTVADVQKVFSYSPLHALVLCERATGVAMAEWLVAALDQPDGKAKAMQEFPVPGGNNDVIRAYYLSGAKSPRDIQQIVTALRTTGGIMKTFASVNAGAIAVRGTPDQLAKADGIIVSMDKQLAP